MAAGTPNPDKAPATGLAVIEQALLDACGDPLLATDAEHRLVRANGPFLEQFRTLWGADLEPGQCVLDAIDVIDDRARLRDQLERALRGEHFVAQGWWGKADRRVDAYRIVYRPTVGPDGAVVGVCAHSRRITDQLRADEAKSLDGEQAQAALAEAVTLFRSTFENAAVGIAHVGLDGRWLRVNQKLCEIVGYPRDELLKLTFQDITHPDDVARDAEGLRRMAAGDITHYAREKRYVRKNGKVIWIHLTVALQRDADGLPDHCITVIQEVTDQVRAREDLRELTRGLEERVAERTQTIERQAEQLRELAGQLTRTEQRERRRVAEALHDQLQQILVAAKMRLSRLGSRQKKPEDAALVQQTAELIGSAIEASSSLAVELSPPVLFNAGLLPAIHWLASHMHETHGLTVRIEQDDDAPEPASPEVRAFAFQAVRELMVNVARHAGVDEAAVELAPAEERFLRICVRDSGRGLSGRDPLARGDVTRFGLFSIQQRLQLLGGRLSIDEAENGGCIAELLVPIEAVNLA